MIPGASVQKGDSIELEDGTTFVVAKVEFSTPTTGVVTLHDKEGDTMTVGGAQPVRLLK